jgi:acetylornithine deacetylase/succinyl-diaminopimelate desuccinylase-like protein
MLRKLAIAMAMMAFAAPALAQIKPDEQAFRDIYKEMVEIDSSATTGSCTKVVRAAETRLKAAGFGLADYEVVVPEGKPDDGNIVAWIKGADASRKAALLLAHIDVVDAKRADWVRDPFTLYEENGFFYGRGSFDDKAMAAVFLDLMVRLKQEKSFRPKRTIKMALTCGEETSNRVNGVDYLVRNRRELIDAAFAINEGGQGRLSEAGKPLWLSIGVGQKIHQVVALEITNPGGHSSRPTPDNAIYRLATALKKIEAYKFPVEFTDVVRESFAASGPIEGGKIGEAKTALAKNPNDAAALAVLSANLDVNPQLRTTCIATQLEAGHAANALPQRAKAILSCRTMQTLSGDQLIAQLTSAVGDPEVKVSIEKKRDSSPPLKLSDEVMGPIRKTSEKMWPGVPLVPSMAAGANDGRFLLAVGIPTYGVSGMFAIPEEVNAHGLNEKIRVKSLYEGRDFLEAITRAYAQ